MVVLSSIAEGFGLAIGSLLAAMLLCWLCWNAFKILRHPEWGPPLVLAIVVTRFGGDITSNLFFTSTLMFAGIAAALCWPAGKDWRQGRVQRLALARVTIDQ